MQNTSIPTIHELSQKFFSSNWAYLIIVLAGLASALLSLAAYAPADGPDGGDYYLHAAYLAGEEVPAGFALYPPLLPLLIFFFRYGIGQIFGLIFLQALFSTVQGMLFYWALREYDKGFAFISAVLICFDMQTKVIHNFVSTEPVYIFLLSAAFCVLLVRLRDTNNKWLEPKDWLIAFCLALLYFTRAVGRFLILPFGLSFLLFTRSWKRSIVLMVVYFASTQVFSLVYGGFVSIDSENVAGINNDVQWAVPLFRGGLLEAQNGEASAELVALSSQCEDPIPARIRCIMEINGQKESLTLISRAFREMVIAKPFDYSLAVLRHFFQFLSLTGQQYSQFSPAQAQCQDLDTRVERNFLAITEMEWLGTVDSSVDLEAFRETIERLNGIMCPPWPESVEARILVDTIAGFYEMISPPRAYLFCAFILLGVLAFARKYLAIAISAMLVIFYHAGISAVIFNVQSRYVVVTNGLRILLFVVFCYLIFGILQAILRRFSKKSLD
jgi:hypothetical protein